MVARTLLLASREIPKAAVHAKDMIAHTDAAIRPTFVDFWWQELTCLRRHPSSIIAIRLV